MRKHFLGVMLLLPFALMAQRTECQGLLWKISGNGLKQPSYLYGTMHVSNKVAFHLSDSFYKAIESVDMVALEINPETWMETMTTDQEVADDMGNVFSMRGDYSNTGFYKRIFELEQPENSFIGEAIGQELGILNSLLYRTSNYNAEFEEDTYLDLFIYQAGRKQGKEVGGLEYLGLTSKLHEQAEKPIEDKEERERLKEQNERNQHLLQKLLDGKTYGELMEDAYRRGDLDLLDSMARLAETNPKEHDLIVIYRNEKMAEKMDSIMRIKSLFAAVGAAHLPNTYGMVHLLREMGYTVRAVDNTKGDFGRKKKDWLEEKFITHHFDKRTSFDGSFSVPMPGPLYEFPEANNVMMAAYPDMANGANYTVTRIFTFAPLHGMTQEQYMDKIDSLLYENIPGKIKKEERIEIDGYPAFRILNQTKKGDFQRYTIVVTPIELIIVKLGGKKEYVNREEVQAFEQGLEFHNDRSGEWKQFSPSNTAYEVEMPGNLVYEAENNAFSRGYWKKSVQSFDPKTQGYFAVLNRSYSDIRFMEEDTFELIHISKQFLDQFGYQVTSSSLDSFEGLSRINIQASKEGQEDVRLQLILRGEQYYLLLSQTSQAADADRFFNSFLFGEFTYSRPFELQKDTTLCYDVISPVEKNKGRSFYRYYDDDEENTDHEEKNLSATYYNKETDETIHVYYKKFHKYAHFPVIDSIWSERRNTLTQTKNFYIVSDTQWQDGEHFFLETVVSDTNSSRNVLSRSMVKDGVMYSIKTEIRHGSPYSKFVDTFYATFTPWDTVIGQSPLVSKADSFLADLRSSDSITREAAFNSLDMVYNIFEDEDIPKIIQAVDRGFDPPNDVSIREKLLYAFYFLEHPAEPEFLKRKYQEVGDTVSLQVPILAAMADLQTKQSTKNFLRMLEQETPLTDDDYKLDYMFYPFADSLELTKELYPDLFMFSALPEYKEKVYSYLARAKDSGFISKRTYRKQVKQIAWEANNEAKRMKAEEAEVEAEDLEEASRYELYNYNNSLYNYAVLLLPYIDCKKEVAKYFDRLEQLRSAGLQMDLAVLKAKHGLEVHDSTWTHFAADPNHRYELYNRLLGADLMHLFPKEYSGQTDLALSQFAYLHELNAVRDTLTFVKRVKTVIDEDTGYVCFFKYKSRWGDDWKMGYLGLQAEDTTSFEIKHKWSADYMQYNRFEDLDLQLQMQIRKLQMADRPRYRVQDEKRFESLNTKRSFYGYF